MHRLKYPNTDTPINKKNILDPLILSIWENSKVQDRMTELITDPLQGFSPDMQGLKGVHEYLFQDTYQTAGRIRGESVNLFGKSITPELPTGWAKAEQRGGKVEIVARFSAAPLTDARNESLANGTKSLNELLAKQTFGEAAQKEMLPVLSKMIGDINHIHPFWDGNGRAMKAFIEQTNRAFGLNANTRKMTREQWVKASSLAKDGKSASLTKLLKSTATVMTKEELIRDTYKAESLSVDPKNRVDATEGLKTPAKRSLFSRLFRRNETKLTPKMPVVEANTKLAPPKPTLDKSAKIENFLPPEGVQAKVSRIGTNTEIDSIINNARAAQAKRGDRLPEIGKLQDSILEAAKKDIPLLGNKANPALIAEMGQNKILMGEVLAAQGAVDQIAEIKSLMSKVEAAKAEKPLTPRKTLDAKMQDLKNSAGSSKYASGLADNLAAMNPQFARGYYASKRITTNLIEAVMVKTEVSPDQMKQAVKALDPVQKAEAHTLDAAKGLFKNPEGAIAKLASLKTEQGLNTEQVNRLVKTKPETLGQLRAFPKSPDDMAKKRAVAKMRQTVESQDNTVGKAVSDFKAEQLRIIEGLKASVKAPSPDLEKNIEKSQTSVQKLKALPDGADKARVHKEATRFTESLNEKTQIFGQAIPGVSDKAMLKVNALNQQAANVKVATIAKTQTKNLNIGKGLGL